MASAYVLEREKFDPTWLGVLISPFYIVRKRLVDSIRYASKDYDGDILDFGCGSKPYEQCFARARSYVGVDIETSGHSHHNSRIDHFYDGKTLPFADAIFDHVVAFEVFEHVFNLEEILLEISRVLKPGGNILISTPFMWGEHEKPFDFGRYTSFGMTSLLERHHFRVEQVRKTTSDGEAAVQLFATFLYESLAPRQGMLKAIFQLAVIAPVTMFGLIIGKLLPSPGNLYSNILISARKRESASARP